MTKAFSRRDIQRGYGSAERPVTAVLWERDSRPEDVATLGIGNHEPDRRHVNFERYYDPAYAKLEIEKLWRKCWLYACREEDLPNIGDRVPFGVGPLSFIIVRSAPDTFRAFYNSCLHRGTQLCSKPESGDRIRCPYHAWEWGIDGTLKRIPSHWDFQGIDRRNGSLREVRLERWGGFIYINAAADAPPLMEALGPVPEHFNTHGIEDRYTAARFRKLVRANWKICQEAFMESYHVIATHPEALPFNGDSQTQYDLWAAENGHVGRQATPSAVPSMHAPSDASAAAAAQVYATIMKSWHYTDADMPELDPNGNLRAQIAEWHRVAQSAAYGRDCSNVTDTVMVDSLLYFIFPQSTIWLSESLPFTYSFTPHASDPELSYFEVRMLLPVPAGQPRPPSAPAIEVGIDEQIAEKAHAFGFLAQVFDQDMKNMPIIQAGMKAADPARHYSLLGTYQEMFLQHWNEVMDDYMSR